MVLMGVGRLFGWFLWGWGGYLGGFDGGGEVIWVVLMGVGRLFGWF